MRTLTLLTAGTLAVGSFAGGGATALAHNTTVDQTTTDPAVPPVAAAASTVTLPLLGAPLIIDVATDAGGGLVDVSLNQADDYTADRLKANNVAFVNDEGTTKVRVSSHWGGQQVSAKASTLAEISGLGGWTGDVFGDGQTTTVSFTVGATEAGGPDITGVTVESPATFEIGATEYRDGEWHGKNSQVATASVAFEQNGERRSLEITAVVKTSDDGSSSNVILGLSGVRGRAIADGEAVGAHTWSGALCDGTVATIQYTVNADGSISGTTATPEAQISERGDRAWVAFSRREAVAISTSERHHRNHRHDDGDEADETDELSVGTSERISCDRTDPTVNTDIDPDATNDDHKGRGDHGDHRGGDKSGWGDHDGRRDGGDQDGSDDRDDQEASDDTTPQETVAFGGDRDDAGRDGRDADRGDREDRDADRGGRDGRRD